MPKNGLNGVLSQLGMKMPQQITLNTGATSYSYVLDRRRPIAGNQRNKPLPI
jgi:hypothetical protein